MPTSSIVTRRLAGERMRRATCSRTSSSPPSEIDWTPLVGRLKRQHAEVEAAVEQLGRHLARRHAPHFDARLRMLARETIDDRQQAVDRRLVRPDDDPAAADLLELPDGRLGLAASRSSRVRVVLEQPAGLGQRAVARGAVEQPLAQLVLQPADGLADRRLGPVQLLGGRREASIRRPRRGMRSGPAAASMMHKHD